MSITPFLEKVSGYIINPLILIMFSVSFIYFGWGIIKLITADANGKEEAKSTVIWGLVGMFIMFSTYGIISLIVDTFEIRDQDVSFIKSKL
ncbi:MAG: hypothetical protein ACYCZW_03175 [Minisyncoccota bacterium]